MRMAQREPALLGCCGGRSSAADEMVQRRPSTAVAVAAAAKTTEWQASVGESGGSPQEIAGAAADTGGDEGALVSLPLPLPLPQLGDDEAAEGERFMRGRSAPPVVAALAVTVR